jgi:hypothetical protein
LFYRLHSFVPINNWRNAIRFIFGKDNTPEDVNYLLEVSPKVVENLRRLFPSISKTLTRLAAKPRTFNWSLRRIIYFLLQK